MTAVVASSTSDKKLRRLVNQVPAMIAYLSPDLTYRFGNPAYCNWFARDPQQLIGKHISEVLGADVYALHKTHIDSALDGHCKTFECRVSGPAGTGHCSLVHYVPDMVAGSAAGLFVHVSDLTSLKAAEEALLAEKTESSRLHDLLAESSAELGRAQQLGFIGSWSMQLSDGQLTWSPGLFHVLGCDPAAGAPTAAEQASLYKANSYSRLLDAVAHTLETGEPYQLDMSFVRPDGSEGWLDARGEAVADAEGKIRQLRGMVQDITERRRIQDELAQQHELLHVTLQSIGDAVITTDAGGWVTWLNPVAERMTGWLTAEAQGCPLTQVFNIVNEETRALTENPVATCLTQGKIVGLANHTLLISRDGTEFGIEDSAAPIRNAAGDVLGVVLVFHDVSEQRRMSGEMTYRATHDALTGLVNRAEFETQLLRVLRKAHEEQSDHALLYIDLDQFKLVNDTCGHAIGDQLLQQVGKLVGETVRARDTVARMGGDEFAVILEHCAWDQASVVAQKICDRMDDFRFVHDDRRFRIGASIGLVPFDRRWTSIAAIQQAADTSCYAAKEAGRNRVHAWFDTDLTMRARHFEMQWTSRIERALDDDGFVLFAQRIQALKRMALT